MLSKKLVQSINVVMQNALSRLNKLCLRGITLMPFYYFAHKY